MKLFAAGLLALALAAGAPAGSASPAPGLPEVDGVPVLAQTMVGNVMDSRQAVLSVHGVRRIGSATVLYFSMGLPKPYRTGKNASFTAYGNGNLKTLSQNPGANAFICAAAVIDVASARAYTALRVAAKGPTCITTGTDITGFRADEDALGVARVAYAVLAPIPGDLERVDVFIGSQLMQDVPVQDGLLEPLSKEDYPVVGEGWPEVDVAAIADAVEPERAVFALRTRVESLQDSVTTDSRADGESLELDSSVLFAFGEATLTPEAAGVIADVATRITAAGTFGTLAVTGHTDDVDTDAFNLDLSQRRADAVAAALRPSLPEAITITAVGAGEAQPIADNATEEGRALNRRVTITLSQ